MKQVSIRTKTLPLIGFLGHLRRSLYAKKIWEVEVRFTAEVKNLGCTYHDHYRADVTVFTNDGEIDGWQGSYGGSYAMMYSQGRSALAAGGKINVSDVPPNVAILEITHGQTRWGKVYINPIHQAKLLPAAPEDIDTDRVKAILKVFTGLKAAWRHDPLHELNVTTEELEDLVTRGWLKCHSGKSPHRLPKPIYVNGPCMYKRYDLGGAKVTTDGKNLTRA